MKRVLIVDDNADNLFLLRFILQKRGYEVIEARDGNEAVATALREEPDLVIMDIQLPGIDGLEATRKIREAEPGSHTPIVALTAFAMHGDAERALQAGCDRYISKPINVATFAAEIERYATSALQVAGEA